MAINRGSYIKIQGQLGGTYGAINHIYLRYKQATPPESLSKSCNSSGGTTCL